MPPETNENLMNKYLNTSKAPFYQVKVIAGAYHGLEIYASFCGEAWDWPSGYWTWAHKEGGIYETVSEFLNQL